MHCSVVVLLCVLGLAASADPPTLPPPFEEECVSGKYPPPKNISLPTYIVNLDTAPEDRWNDVVRDRKAQILNLIDFFKDFARHLGRIGVIAIDFVDRDFEKIVPNLPEPYQSEMRGIAKVLGISEGEVALYNIFYEVFQICTAIVAQDPSGKMYHARNLDFGLFLGWDERNNTWGLAEELRPALVNVDFQTGGRTVFRSVTYGGYVGILTGVKPGIFSVTINSRFNSDGGWQGIIDWILGEHDESWVSLLARDTLGYAQSFDEAVKNLGTAKLVAPVYYTVAGPEAGQGIVLTRARGGTIQPWAMTNTTNPGAPWYILQTNYDHWQSPLFVDDRRTPANKCMLKKGQSAVSFSGLFDVLSSRPVLNKLTTYTALMELSTGRLETYIQYCQDPCWPW